MQTIEGIGLDDVREVYSGAEGDLWELLMGQQIHVGGLQSSDDLAERAGIDAGGRGVDLCCCNGAGTRFLVRFRGVHRMVGVDGTPKVIERGRALCAEEGLEDRIELRLSDVRDTGLPEADADFVWGEDAWCYVEDKPRLIQEACRIVRPGGTIAFTDWVEGPAGLTEAEAERTLRFMKFPSLASLQDYPRLLEKNGCEVLEASDTGRFALHLDLYAQMVSMQLTYDALRILGFDRTAFSALSQELGALRELAHADRIVQGRFIARRRT